jgi:predicted RNase H-like nuclease
MEIIGLDACKYGWCGIGYINSKMVYGCFANLNELIQKHPEFDRILIDIPIGLSSENFKRTADSEARTYLKKRKSSIFSPPCRDAIYAENYQQALAINREIEGKGISIQAYNISAKIKEVDEWINSKPKKPDIFEAHPELCFKTLNQYKDLEFSKHDKQGIEERKRIIFKHQKNLKKVYDQLLEHYKRTQLKPDDILDAMALYLINRESMDLKYISDKNDLDQTGKKVCIVYG